MLPSKYQKKLVDKLLLCGELRSSKEQRNDIVSSLAIEISSRIERADNAQSDLSRIVSKCSEFDNIPELLEIVRQSIGDTIAVKELHQLWAKIYLAWLVEKTDLPSSDIDEIFTENRPPIIQNKSIPDAIYDKIEMLWQMSRDKKPVLFFAIMIAQRCSSDANLYNSFIDWGLDFVNVPDVSITEEEIERFTESRRKQESQDVFLLVVIQPSITRNQYKLRMYLWRSAYDFSCIFLDIEKTYSLAEIPQLIVDTLDLHGDWPGTIEFLLPLDLLNQQVGYWEMEVDDEETGVPYSAPLQGYFNTFVRSLERHEVAAMGNLQRRKISNRIRLLKLANKAWLSKWQHFHELDNRPIAERFYWIHELEIQHHAHNALRKKLLQDPENNSVLIVKNAVKELFATTIYAGIPIMIWPRSNPSPQDDIEVNMKQLLSCLNDQLPQSLYDLQLSELENEYHISHQITLLWDDPNRTLNITGDGSLV